MRKIGVLLMPVFFCLLCSAVAPVAAYSIEVRVSGCSDYGLWGGGGEGAPEPEAIRFSLVYYVVKPSSADYTYGDKLDDTPLFLYYSALIRVDKGYTLSVQVKHPEEPWAIQLFEAATRYNALLPEGPPGQLEDPSRRYSEKSFFTLRDFLHGYVFSDMGAFAHRTMGQEPSLDYVPIHSQLFIPSENGRDYMGCSTPEYKQDLVNPLPDMDTLNMVDFLMKGPPQRLQPPDNLLLLGATA